VSGASVIITRKALFARGRSHEGFTLGGNSAIRLPESPPSVGISNSKQIVPSLPLDGPRTNGPEPQLKLIPARIHCWPMPEFILRRGATNALNDYATSEVPALSRFWPKKRRQLSAKPVYTSTRAAAFASVAMILPLRPNAAQV